MICWSLWFISDCCFPRLVCSLHGQSLHWPVYCPPLVVDLRIWRDCATRMGELVGSLQLDLINEDYWLILLFMGGGLPMTSTLEREFFQSKKLFAATLLSFSVGDGGISCPKVFLWSCRRLKLNSFPSVCKRMYFPSPLPRDQLTRTVNGVRATRRLRLKPFEGLWQVVALSGWIMFKTSGNLAFPGFSKDRFCSRCQIFRPDR